MELSILIARIIAVAYLSFGFGLLFSNSYYKREIIKLYDDSSYIILVGFFAIIVGFLIIENHNIWENNWTVLVTIFGWLILIEGIIMLVFPKFILLFKPLMRSKYVNTIILPVVFIVGLLFAYFGFYLN